MRLVKKLSHDLNKGAYPFLLIAPLYRVHPLTDPQKSLMWPHYNKERM
jgi:hypothetical protein